jgi:hypothetical protein
MFLDSNLFNISCIKRRLRIGLKPFHDLSMFCKVKGKQPRSQQLILWLGHPIGTLIVPHINANRRRRVVHELG